MRARRASAVLSPQASAVDRIRDAHLSEASALESLQRRASDVWEEYRAQLVAHPEAIAAPHEAIAAGWVRVAVDAGGRLLGFATAVPGEAGSWELEDLFVEPDVMRRGVGRLLVEDLAKSAADMGAMSLDVTANPNAAGFYSRLGFGETGRASTRFGPAPRMTLDLCLIAADADAAAIADLMTRFLRAVSFERGRPPAYHELPRLFIPSGMLIRTTGATPESSTVQEFVAAREAAFDAGDVDCFHEQELSERTEMFGNVAHRFSP
jgi:GNAT superfamily N-acetyltransferase